MRALNSMVLRNIIHRLSAGVFMYNILYTAFQYNSRA